MNRPPNVVSATPISACLGQFTALDRYTTEIRTLRICKPHYESISSLAVTLGNVVNRIVEAVDCCANVVACQEERLYLEAACGHVKPSSTGMHRHRILQLS